MGNRAFFRPVSEPATLIVEDVKPSDAGLYRCRVDFLQSPTKNNKVRLQVIRKYDRFSIRIVPLSKAIRKINKNVRPKKTLIETD